MLGRGLCSSVGLPRAAGRRCSVQEQSPSEGPRETPACSSCAMTSSATTFSQGSCSKTEHAHTRGEFPSSTSFPPQDTAGIPTTKSQRIPTANCSPTAQPSALQGPEQQDGVRSCRTRLGGSSLQAQTPALSRWNFFHAALEKQNLFGQRLTVVREEGVSSEQPQPS